MYVVKKYRQCKERKKIKTARFAHPSVKIRNTSTEIYG